MGEFLRAGGFAMWFVMLFSGASLAAAIVFAVKAELKKLAIVRAMTACSVFAICCGVLTNFLAVTRYVSSDESLKGDQLTRIIMVGLGESVTPAILGFAILSVAWMIVAVGTRRVQDYGA